MSRRKKQEGPSEEESNGSEGEEELEVELELDSEGRIAGTRESKIRQDPFRVWNCGFGSLPQSSGRGGSRSADLLPGASDLRDTLINDCEYLFTNEETHGDSFIIPASSSAQDLRCSLEKLAWEVFSFHTRDCKFDKKRSCAEWWVQVRGNRGEANAAGGALKRRPRSEKVAPSGIGFHWDKDEDLLDSTGVCICPQISTVTYLTSGGAPTMVLGKKPQMEYDDDEGMYCRDISQAWISHPEDAKHVAFSGNLLHGAPRHMSRDDAYRVTFLVNIWLNYSPVGLGPLPQQHLSCLSQFQSVKALLDLPQPTGKTGKISEIMDGAVVTEIAVGKRIRGILPFKEYFGPTGTEHILEFKLPDPGGLVAPKGKGVAEQGSLAIKFERGFESSISRNEGTRGKKRARKS